MKYKCCNYDQRCPEVNIEGNHIYITDDFGGKVTLTKSEFKEIINKDYGDDLE